VLTRDDLDVLLADVQRETRGGRVFVPYGPIYVTDRNGKLRRLTAAERDALIAAGHSGIARRTTSTSTRTRRAQRGGSR
jgi:hypothetical protein